MFVRRKKNRSGSVSVVVVSKERGKFREVQTIGVSSNEDEINHLYRQGQIWIREHSTVVDMFDRHHQIAFEQTAVRSIIPACAPFTHALVISESFLFPAETIRSLNIEQKVTFMNQKKEALSRKYPQLSTLKPNDFAKYVNNCVKQSIRVNDFFLSKEINIYQPTLKFITSVENFDTMSELLGFLSDWMSNPSNQELTIFMYKDGTSKVIDDNRNTTKECYWPTSDITTIMGQHYYAGKEISGFAHTHPSGNTNASTEDREFRDMYPGGTHYVYTNGGFWKF